MDMSATLPALPGRECDRTRYAIARALPTVALKPASADEAAALVRTCSERGLAVVPWGGGVALSLETQPPPRYDVALDVRGLDDLVAYDPDDYTVTAGCGITLAALRAALEARGQELPLEAAAEGAATLGGALAANASGARRRAFGAPRDRILGGRFVTGDGVLARTGGRVVKNVAGHAVHRLLVGSRGGLGVLLEASLKLLPAPPARVAIVHGLPVADLADPARWEGLARREPAVLTVLEGAAASGRAELATGAPCTVVTGFEGDPAWVEAGVAFVEQRLGRAHAIVRGADAAATWRTLSDLGEHPGARLTFGSAHVTPAAFATAAGTPAARRVLHAPSGRLLEWPAAEPAALPARVRALAAHGFTLTEARGTEPDGPLPPASVLGLRASLAAALDPAGVMAYGARWRAGR
jgi:glycolate oxidase FAD binding subunit